MIYRDKRNMNQNKINILFFLIAYLLFNSNLHSQNWNLVKKAVASDRDAGDSFGSSVSIYGDYAVVGAPYDDFASNLGTKFDTGGAYLLKRGIDGKWIQIQKLIPNDLAADDFFGFSVSIYENTILIGSRNTSNENGTSQVLNSGSVYVFEKNSSDIWTQVQKLKSPNSKSVAFGKIRIRGNQAIISDYAVNLPLKNGGECYIFERNPVGIWSYKTTLTVPDLNQNDGVGIGVDIQGNFAAISSKNTKNEVGLDSLARSGSVYTYLKDDSGSWIFSQKLVAPDRGLDDNFGKSLSIDSNFMVIGAYSDKDDENTINPIYSAGSAYLYKLDENNKWVFYQKICPKSRISQDNFGWSVSSDNGIIAIGALESDASASGGTPSGYRAGSVHMFKMDELTGRWIEYYILKSLVRTVWDKFGYSVALNKNRLIIGATYEAEDELELNTKSNAGAAYIFENSCNKMQFLNNYYCAGSNVKIGSQFYSTPGIYNDTLSSLNGCDSINVYLTTQRQNSTRSFSYSICQGDSILLFDKYIKVAGLYSDTLRKTNGCDSIFLKSLTVKPVFKNYFNKQICSGDSILLGGMYQKKSGVYTDKYISKNICDSFNITNLVVGKTFESNKHLSLCQGEGILLEGVLQTTNGMYYDTLQTLSGCDSVIITHLTIIPNKINNQYRTICFGDSLLIGSYYRDLDGIYLDTLKNQHGCDSIIRLNLNVLSEINSTHSIGICNGDSLFLGGYYQSNSGIYSDTLANSIGCDSIVHSILYHYPTNYLSLNTSICEGDSLFLGGKFHSTNGIYYDTLQNIKGCDSIIIHTLSVTPIKIGQIVDKQICEGDSILISNNYFFNSGVYNDTLQSISGCDSLVFFNVIVNDLPFVNLESFQNEKICKDDGLVNLPNGFPLNGYYSGNGVTGQYLDPNLMIIGKNQVYYSFVDNNNCLNNDSSTVFLLNCLGIEELVSDRIFTVSPNPSFDHTIINLSDDIVGDVKLVLANLNGKTILEISVYNEKMIRLNTDLIHSGIYVVSILDEISNITYSRKKLLIQH